MRGYRTHFITLCLLAGIIFFTQSHQVSACMQLPVYPPTRLFHVPSPPVSLEAVENGMTILIGTVVASTENPEAFDQSSQPIHLQLYPPQPSPEERYEITVEVERYLTNEGPQTITVRGFGRYVEPPSVCPISSARSYYIHARPGERYLFFFSREMTEDASIPVSRFIAPLEEDIEDIIRLSEIADAPYVMTIPQRIKLWFLYEATWHHVKIWLFSILMCIAVPVGTSKIRLRRRMPSKNDKTSKEYDSPGQQS